MNGARPGRWVTTSPPRPPILEVRGLVKHFPSSGGGVFAPPGVVRAVDGIDFTIGEGETLGLVGESGCGKTTTGRLVTRLLDPTAGEIVFEGSDIAQIPGRRLGPVRRRLQIIFQDPYGSLNPRHTAGQIVAMPLVVNGITPSGGIERRVSELLERVGLSPEHYNRYPHEFSTGQRQRIGIARALALEPRLIVADEPVSALDVSIQAQILNLLSELQRDLNLSFLFIAHDLAVVRHFAHRVAVMHEGKIVEMGDRREIFEAPRHPYTAALLSAVPDVAAPGRRNRREVARHGSGPTAFDPRVDLWA